jgi:hypothetical protein
MNERKLKIVSDKMQIETTKVKVLNRDIEIILPRTKFVEVHDDLFTYEVYFPLSPYKYQTGWRESREFNNTSWGTFSDGKYHNLQEDGFRHISLAELVQILSKRSDMDDEIYLRIIEALIMSNGYSTRSDVGTGHWGIYVDDGIRVEDGYATIFKGISGRLKWYEGETLGPMWNSSYHLEKDCVVSNKQFCVKRLFRKKLQDELKERPLILEDIYDASPDLIEYLFEQEFSDLPESVQYMSVKFPLGNKEERVYENERGIFVMPMAMLYHTHMSLEDSGRNNGITAQFYQAFEGFRIVPDTLSMPANYCNSILPVSMHNWGVRGER